MQLESLQLEGLQLEGLQLEGLQLEGHGMMARRYGRGCWHSVVVSGSITK